MRPCPNCQRPLADTTTTACMRCWQMLPASLRAKIHRHQRGILDGTSTAHNLDAQMRKARRIWSES